jgi:glutamyl-Q tRNA(Asp) synthetase
MSVTRFAPSPTGLLHLGHAYAARFAYDAVRQAGGQFLLRIEDIDPTRCKPELIAPILEDLHWLGLSWDGPVRLQSEHLADYQNAFDRLQKLGVVYPCFCTRRDIEQAATAPHAGEEGPVYPGTCRILSSDQRAEKLAVAGKANWRLDLSQALAITGELLLHDRVHGRITATPELFGDVVLCRKDVPTSYHLSVTVDDHLQGITLVTRGEDLFTATHVHRVLQALLGYAPPDYHHHKLCIDASGRRYAKRDQSVTIRALRESGVTPEDVWRMID